MVIKVDINKLNKAAKAIERYITYMDEQMKTAEKSVSTLESSWQGEDATKFSKKWDEVQSSESAYGHMRAALIAYAKYLILAARKYDTAAQNARNLAGRLPK